MVPSLCLEVLSINQNPIVNVELSSILHIQGTLFVVDALVDIMHMVAHYSHLVEAFLSGRRGNVVVVIMMNGVRIEAVETYLCGEFVGSSGCGIVGKYCNRYSCLPAVLPIMAADAQVLIECLDRLFTESISLQVVGCRNAQVNIETSVCLSEQL